MRWWFEQLNGCCVLVTHERAVEDGKVIGLVPINGAVIRRRVVIFVPIITIASRKVPVFFLDGATVVNHMSHSWWNPNRGSP